MLAHADGLEWGPSHQIRPVAETCRAARIRPEDGSFHILRHTAASHLVMAGVPLNVVAHNLGHSSTLMTERHYAHFGAQLYLRDGSGNSHRNMGGPAEESNIVPIGGGVR